MSVTPREAFEKGKQAQKEIDTKKKKRKLPLVQFEADLDLLQAIDNYCSDLRINRSSFVRGLVADLLRSKGYLK